MKTIIIGDTHFGIKKDDSYFLDYQINYFNNVVFNEIKNRNVDNVIFLGDIFDNRKKINVRTVKLVKEKIFNELDKLGIPIYIIIGNHDIFYNQNVETNTLSVILDCYKNFIIVDNCTFVDNCMLIPWIAEENRMDIVDAISFCTRDYLFGHLEINGASMGSEEIENGIPYEAFRHYKKVFSGHVHIKQEFENIYYTGIPYQLTWGDCYGSQGIHYFDSNTGELVFIENKDKIFFTIYLRENTKLGNPSVYKDKYVKVFYDHTTKHRINFIRQIFNPANLRYLEWVDTSENNFNNENEEDIEMENYFSNPMEYVKNYIIEKVPISKKYFEEMEYAVD